MTKQEVAERVNLNGKPLSLDLFTWDEETYTFSSDQNDLVFDFKDVYRCTFSTGWYCTFNTGKGCTFKTGSECTFNTFSNCTFHTGSECTFHTGDGCAFNIFLSGYFTQSKSIVVVRGYDSSVIYNLNDYKNFTRLTDSARSKPIIDTKIVDDNVMVVLSVKHIDKYTIYKTQYIDDYFNDNSKTQFVAEYNEFTAHGDSLKQAISNVEFKTQELLKEI